MKKLFLGILLAFFCFALGATYPKYTGFINDNVNIFSAQEQQILNNLGAELEQKTGVQFALLTVDSLGDESIEEYANKVFETWGIGKKGQDNGILLLCSLSDRKIRLEVGYGLEGIINDGKAGEIIDKAIIPYFRAGQIKEGLISGYITVARVLAQYYQVDLNIGLTQRTNQNSSEELKLSWGHLVLIFLVLWFLLGTRLGRSMLPWIFLLLLSSSGRGGGGFGNFGGSGGFGGFGGGLSGGGGASRGW